MASAADPSLWEDSNGTTPPQQWELVASDSRWWWTLAQPDPVTYIGDRQLPALIEFDWEIVTPPDLPVTNINFIYFLPGVGETTIALGNSVGTGSISIPLEGYDPDEGDFTFRVETSMGSGAYGGSVAILGPDVPEVATIFDAHLSWTAGTVGTYPIDLYRLYRSINGAAYSLLAEVSAQDERSYVDAGIDADVPHAYRVFAVDDHGNQSTQSNIVTLQLAQDVAPVLVVTPDANPDTLHLSWSAATFGNGHAVTGYWIYRMNSDDTDDGGPVFTEPPEYSHLQLIDTVDGATLVYADTEADDPGNYQNYQYAYYVRAVTAQGEQSRSNIYLTPAPS